MSEVQGPAEHIMFLITTASVEEGERIARALLEERLAACVNLVPAVRSFFWWEGKVQEEGEVLLIGKGRADLFPKVQNLVRALHSYTVPEIIAFPITAGLPDYLAWINDSTLPPGSQ
ncbi:MAG: divalent-cation tolerance protein CutA [Candidatus Methylomirabilales bacterium]